MKTIFIIICSLFFVPIQAQENATLHLSLGSSNELSAGYPSEVGLDSIALHTQVDSIMLEGIRQEAFPGAQLLVAKQGKIIFHKAYGYHTYDSIQAVALNDIYDLASVTKITAALPALMKLHDEGKLQLDSPFSDYWKPWKKIKHKKALTVREILDHRSRTGTLYRFFERGHEEERQAKKAMDKH